MVIDKNIKKHALISVYKKNNLNKICKILKKYNIGIISTGSTFKKIKSLGYKCIQVSKLTKTNEILGGRVKTIHPKIFASILYNRNKIRDLQTFEKMIFPRIDFVIVNFYPFKKTIEQKTKPKNIIEMIDIGGPSLVRAAAKNFNDLTVITSPNDYDDFCINLLKNNGFTDLVFRERMASKAFKLTSVYDKSIFNWLCKKNGERIKLRYGENPNQKSELLKLNNKTFFDYQTQGKTISYNNILDINSGLDFINEFTEPTAAIIKHNNACGIASSNDLNKAYLKALRSDKKSAFGGVLILNKKIGEQLSKIILKNFYEIIVAPGFDKKSLDNFKAKKNLILINSKDIFKKEKNSIRSVRNGNLIQTIETKRITKKDFKIVSKNNKISKNEYEDILFAFKVVKHIKSNAIVLVKNKQTIGIGAGQMNRYDATRIALMKYKDNFKYKNFVCASDAFFPFLDSLEILFKNNCKCIVQPSGSKNDIEILNYANKKNIKMIFSKTRVFKH